MPSFVAIWIWFCAYLNCAGWTLSALHRLDRIGYTVVFAVGLLALLGWKKKTGAEIFSRVYPPKILRRFKKLFPFCFLLLAGLTFMGGALYAPANFDTLAYRTPRVLHWLAAGQWEWIHSEFPRVNTRSAGFEWITAPLFLFTGTDRLEFLLNIFAFILLPGRVFAVLTRLNVRPRTAWYWMWLFPAGYGYVLQAGSVVNDLFGALMALCAFEFALRGAREKCASWLWTSALAAALMTSLKTFNVVLGPPWLIAFWPGVMVMLRRPLATSLVALMAVGASLVPTAVLNARYCGDWSGVKLEGTPIGGGAEFLRGVANAGGILIYNFQPPVFPFAKQWEEGVKKIIPADFYQKLCSNMEKGLARFPTTELVTEETAGLGCALSFLLLYLFLRKLFAGGSRGRFRVAAFFTRTNLIVAGVWLGLMVLITRSGCAGPTRYLLPIYVVLSVPMLTGGIPSQLTRHHNWNRIGLAVLILTLPVLIFSPQRPLWPAQTILKAFNAEESSNRWLNRIWTVYAVYGNRASSFAPLLARVPADEHVLGFLGVDEPEAALWKPFGARRLRHIRATDSVAEIRERGIKYALVNAGALSNNCGMDYDVWLKRVGGEAVASVPLKIRAGQPPEDWRIIKFN